MIYSFDDTPIHPDITLNAKIFHINGATRPKLNLSRIELIVIIMSNIKANFAVTNNDNCQKATIGRMK